MKHKIKLTDVDSQTLYQQALEVMPGGCSRNTVLRKPHPPYAGYGEGCRVIDRDGNEKIDFANNMCSLIHGHAHPKVVRAVTEQMQRGSAFMLATEIEVLYAQYLCSRNESFDQIRFVNSGTEAVMYCLKAARAFTGRPKIAKVEGSYHGAYDFSEVSQTAKPSNWGNIENPSSVPVVNGTPEAVLNDVVVIPCNDPERAITILNEHAEDIACVLMDLIPHRVNLALVSSNFVNQLHQWTRNNDALLVFDEVITLRTHYGGAQERYDVRPDLTAMGKIIGGGFPVGALAGRRDVMQLMNPLSDQHLFPLSGTFSANPITMAAGYTTMKLFDELAVQRINRLGDRAREGIAEAIRIADMPFSVTGAGSLFRIHMKPQIPQNYREAFASPEEAKLVKAMLDYMFEHDIFMVNTCTGALSTAITEREIDIFIETALNGFREIKPFLAKEAV